MIKRRFAGREADIDRAYAASESFRGLCSDYAACAAALARWEEVASDDGRLRAREYAELLQELAMEIQARLSARTGAGRSRDS